MKKIAFILIATLIFQVPVSGQTWETIGSGVADFLLSNPKSANNMKTEHQVALSIIGNLLNTAGDRKHQINLAEAGKTQVNLNTNTGKQIQLVMDTNGSVYALSNGVIYPISQNIVNEAKEYVLNQQPGYMEYVGRTSRTDQILLPDFNISELRNKWDKENTYVYNKITSSSKLSLYYLENTYKLNESEIYILWDGNYILLSSINQNVLKKYRQGKKIFNSIDGVLTIPLSGDKFRKKSRIYNYYLFRKQIKLDEMGLFTAKWVKDLNNNSEIEFSEFNDIRRNFYENENFVIGLGLRSPELFDVTLTILEQLTGKEKTTLKANSNGKYFDHCFFDINGEVLGSGIYVYHVSFTSPDSNNEINSLSDQFQILPLEPQKNSDSNENQLNTQEQKKTSSKEDMINDLIQMLKEGTISEETFKASIKALENN